jgi:hypothetical protein
MLIPYRDSLAGCGLTAYTLKVSARVDEYHTTYSKLSIIKIYALLSRKYLYFREGVSKYVLKVSRQST